MGLKKKFNDIRRGWTYHTVAYAQDVFDRMYNLGLLNDEDMKLLDRMLDKVKGDVQA